MIIGCEDTFNLDSRIRLITCV